MINFLRRFKKKVKRLIRKAASRSHITARIVAEFRYILLQLRPNRKNTLLRIIQKKADPAKKDNKQYIRHLQKDMIYSRLYYEFGFQQYFKHNFEELSDHGRKKFLGIHEFNKIRRKLEATGRPDILKNKPEAYEVFKDFYKRDALTVSDASQRDEFVAFLTIHSLCILKPLNSYGGHGIMKIEVTNEKPADILFDELITRLPFLLEELIIQDSEMAKFHPQSVNTIRFTTFFNEGKLTKIQSLIRMGRGGSFVDNASSGGLFALVDTDTGIIKSSTMNWQGSGDEYLIHPDSGVQVIGNKIPQWDELNELLEQIVRVLPEQKLVGWDFALSTKGWVLVEANNNPGIQGFDIYHGMRDELLSIFSTALPQ